MKAIKITAFTQKGRKNIQDTKKESAKLIVRLALKKLKIKLSFTNNELIIENPAYLYCEDLDELKNNPKAKKASLGLKQIRQSYDKIGAKEGIDYKIEGVK